MCGENTWNLQSITSVPGSPPRVRGKQKCFTMQKKYARITPACAGKTIQAHITFIDYKDHPRVCGENEMRFSCYLPQEGSPPRVRGKQMCKRNLRQANRITPACAGKTCSYFLKIKESRDHPRVCGENKLSSIAAQYFLGSPPRVRGKLCDI